MTAQIATLAAPDRLFLRNFASDEEDAAWMALSDQHQRTVIGTAQPLWWHAEREHPEWYVGSELAVYYSLEGGGKNFVVPDLFVALAPSHFRLSFDVEAEGAFPAFVLEVVSQESRARDTSTGEGKVRLYGLLGAQEYAIFDPAAVTQPPLQGYRCDADGEWRWWPAEADGTLRSAVLGLTLRREGPMLRLVDRQGNRLRTADEERARAQTEQRRADEGQARAQVERARADGERARAQVERARADEERARADALAIRVAELEARLCQLPPG